MTAYNKMLKSMQDKKTLLCVGLDCDMNKIPNIFSKDIRGLLKFNFSIIDATKKYAAAYKINTAFYEQYGIAGYELLKKTISVIPKHTFLIIDAKRGDIGNTSGAYAKAVFEDMEADAITVAPYMGIDSISPFLDYKEKMVFLLGLTSNIGSNDFQRILAEDGRPYYKHIIEKSSKWADAKQLAYVVGATHPDELNEIRIENPDRTFLIPGVGAQGGDVNAILKSNAGGNALINVSRGIIYSAAKEIDSSDTFLEIINKTTKEYAKILAK